MKRPLVIFGLSSFAQSVAHAFDTFSEFEVVAFSADARFIQKEELAGRPAIAFEQLADRFSPGETAFHAAIEYRWLNDARAQVVRRFEALGYMPASFIHPSSVIGRSAKLGTHQFIMECAVVSEQATLDEGSILFPHTYLGPEAKVGAFNYLHPAATVNRHAEIGHHCVIGSRCNVVEGAKVGSWSFLRAGQQIEETIAPGTTFHPGLRAPGYVVDRRRPSELISETLLPPTTSS